MHPILKKETAKFSEIKSLLEQLNAIKVQERRVKRRLNTKLQGFEFLSEIVDLDMKDKKLTNPLIKYFKSLGVTVHRPPNQDKDGIEDLRVFHKGKMLIIEATSIDKMVATESKLIQILKHVNIRQEENKNYKVFGVSIVNHQDNKPFNERMQKQNYNTRAIKILASNNLTTVSTLTLLNDFIKIKDGKMNVDELLDNLTSIGVYQ
jgi:hypothetical protein